MNYSKRNSAIMVIDAIGYNFGISFISPQTILPMFVLLLSGSQFSIGLLVAIQSMGQLLPQIMAANWIEQLPKKRRYVTVLGIFGERIPFLLLAIAVFLIPGRTAVLFVFFFCFGISYLAAGFNTPAYYALFADAIPLNARGKIMGFGTALGFFMSAGGAYLAKILLETYNARAQVNGAAGLRGYAYCFFIGFLILLISIIPLAFTKETQPPARERRRTLQEFLAEIRAIFRGNAFFRRYLTLQALIQMPYAGIAFITGYAVLSLRVSEGTVAIFTAVFMTTNALGSVLFGHLGDKRGYRLVYIMGLTAAIVMAVIMALSPGLAAVYAALGLSGLFMAAYLVGGNMAMEFDHVHKVSTFTALSFTAAAPFRILLPLIAGMLAESAGAPSLFIVSGVISFIALAFAVFILKEPRNA